MLNKLRFLICFTVTIVCHSAFCQREPLSIIVNSSIEENMYEELRSLFMKTFLENGFSIVERKQVDVLFSEYEDQKREDYFDGKTVKIKIEGAKYYCILDVFDTNQTIKVFLFFVDIFQEKIIFSKSLIFNKNNDLIKEFEKYKNDIVMSIDKNIPIRMQYYSTNANGNVKLLIEKSNLEIGKKIYGQINNDKVCEFEIVKNLSSNMIECSLISFNKKQFGKPKEFNFSSLVYTTELFSELDFSKTICLNNSCLDIQTYYELVVNLNNHWVVEDNFHKRQLVFEQKLQSNELFMNGRSYFELKKEFDDIVLVNLKEIEKYCNYTVEKKNIIIKKGKYDGSLSMIGVINSLLN